MLRLAAAADLPRLMAIRDGAGSDALSDPAAVTGDLLRRLIAAGAVTVAEADGAIAGFAAIDGAAVHLLVDPAQRSRGIGRALLAAACTTLKDAGAGAATLTLAPQSLTVRHYRAAGWSEIGRSASGGLVLKKPL
jgi:GNAT superfamily N-acetyltransferase